MVLAKQGVFGAELETRCERLERFVRSYVEGAPTVLEGLTRAAESAGVSEEISGVVAAARAYFRAEADFIPDHNGVAGLVDDAYLALRLIERTLSFLGEPVIGLTSANDTIAGMIGVSLLKQLDESIAGVLRVADIEQMRVRLLEAGAAREIARTVAGVVEGAGLSRSLDGTEPG